MPTNEYPVKVVRLASGVETSGFDVPLNLTNSTDTASGSRKSIDLEHHKIHAGEAFLFNAFVQLVDTTPRYRVFKAGSKPIHFKELDIASEKGATVVELYESPTYTGGTDATNERVASNRITSVSDDMTIITNPTVTDDGTFLERFYIPGGTGVGGTASGGNVSTNWELDFALNTDYLIKGYRLAGSTGTCWISVKYRWYIGGLS